MRVAERESGPEPQATPPRTANPLLPLLGTDPDDTWLVLDEVRRLPRNPLSARWLDQLLDDPRLAGLPQVREAAVQKLLEFGHPHALLINPEHLAEFRKTHPIGIDRDRMMVGGAIGMVVPALAFVAVTQMRWGPGRAVPLLLALGLLACAGLWALAIGLRARSGRTTRWSLISQVVLGLGVSAGLAWLDPALGAAPLTAVVPVSIAGLAGGWSET